MLASDSLLLLSLLKNIAANTNGTIEIDELTSKYGLSHPQTSWVRNRLVEMGLIVNRSMGIVSITERGREAAERDSLL